MDREKIVDGLSQGFGLWPPTHVHPGVRSCQVRQSIGFGKAHTALCTPLRMIALSLQLCALRTAAKSTDGRLVGSWFIVGPLRMTDAIRVTHLPYPIYP